MNTPTNSGLVLNVLFISFLASAAVALIIYLLKRYKFDNNYSVIERLLKKKEYHEVLKYEKIAHESAFYLPSFYVGEAYEELHEHLEAAKTFEECLLKISESEKNIKENILSHIADNFRLAGKIREALGYYDMIIEYNKCNRKTSLHVAEILMELNRFHNAKQHIERFLKIEPNSDYGIFLYGKIAYNLEMYPLCISQLKKVVDSSCLNDDRKNESLLLLSKAYIKERSFSDAEFCLARLYDNNQHINEVFSLIIEVKLVQNAINQAISFYDAHFNEVTQDIRNEAQYNIATCLWKINHFYEALNIWKEIYLHDSNYKDVKVILYDYKLLLENLFLENIFSPDEEQIIAYLKSLFHINSSTIVDKSFNVWIFINEKEAYFFNRSPSALMLNDYLELEKHVKSNNIINKNLFLFSFNGFVPHCMDYYLFRHMKAITGQHFVDFFNNKNNSALQSA